MGPGEGCRMPPCPPCQAACVQERARSTQDRLCWHCHRALAPENVCHTECTPAGNGWHFSTWIELLPMITELYLWMAFSGVPGMDPWGAVPGTTQRAAAAPAGQALSSLSSHTPGRPGKCHFNYNDFYLVNFVYEGGTQSFGTMCIGFPS